MKRAILYIFAAIGLFSVLKLIYGIWKHESIGSQYLKNCEKVEVGMTVEEARKIMGDKIQQSRENRSEIWTYHNDSKGHVYFLSYPTVYLASSGTSIHFDPNTQLVTGVVCGDR